MIDYIKEIRNNMSKDDWYNLNYFLLNHDDISLEEAYRLFKNNDINYNNFLKENDISKIDINKSVEEVLLAFIQDYLEINDRDGNVNIQEYFKERELLNDMLYKI